MKKKSIERKYVKRACWIIVLLILFISLVQYLSRVWQMSSRDTSVAWKIIQTDICISRANNYYRGFAPEDPIDCLAILEGIDVTY